MTNKQKALLRNCAFSIGVLKQWYDLMLEDGKSDMTKMLSVVISDFEQLLQEWTNAIGHPQKVSGETIVEIINTVTKIINQRISNKKL